MKRRKLIEQHALYNKSDFIEILNNVLNAYTCKDYDIETITSNLIGVDVYYISIYKK